MIANVYEKNVSISNFLPGPQHTPASAPGVETAPEPTTPAPETPLQIRSHRRAQWCWIDNEVVDRYGAHIKATGIGLYTALARYANHHTGTCYPSLARLSQQLGCTHKTVGKYLQRLVQCGLIRVEMRPGHTCLITLLDLAPPSVTPEERHSGKNDQGRPHPGKNDQTPWQNVPDSLVKTTSEPDSPTQTKEPKKAKPDFGVATGERKAKPAPHDETSSWDKPAVVVETPTDRPDEVLTTHQLDAHEQAALEQAAKVILRARWGNRVPAIVPVVQATVLELLEGLRGLWDGLVGAPATGEETVPCTSRAA
jgi:biotin operon repressor